MRSCAWPGIRKAAPAWAWPRRTASAGTSTWTAWSRTTAGSAWARRSRAGTLPAGQVVAGVPEPPLAKEPPMISRISPWLLALAFLGLAIVAMVMPLKSDTVPYAFLFDPTDAKNDQQRYLNAVVQDSGVTGEELQPLLSKLRPLEKQLPIALFVARESGKPLADVVELRKSERYWLDVFKKTGVKPKVLFDGVDGKAPEPYKAAWIEYRMKRDPELTDEQVRELVSLQLAHRISGQPVAELVKEAAKGRTPEQVLSRPKTAKAEPSPSAAPAKAAHASKGK